MKKRIYVASPLGFSSLDREFAYPEVLRAIDPRRFEILDPWKLPKGLKRGLERLGAGRNKAWAEWSRQVAERNRELIESADGLVAVLNGLDVDSGTAAEIGYAAALGKPVVGFRDDVRPAGDNVGTAVNLQVEYFVTMRGGRVVRTLSDLRKALEEILV